MGTNCSKKATTIREMLSKPLTKTSEHLPDTPHNISSQVAVPENEALQFEEPVTHTFLENLLGALSDDTQALKCFMAADVKEHKKDLEEMGQSLDTQEKSGDQCEEELNDHQIELLRDRNKDILPPERL
ncbi:hypothetical protein NDU88_002711 [Pleurodeles waltl]|uniref:Uncharacterized protein n=1 Tax=Pleurodeles waltl TaxID=8319 RepID=A0AAV7T370_PLEWA|nr:hypothetical protein NDU88_002711 [Pleurodeles waltl]